MEVETAICIKLKPLCKAMKFSRGLKLIRGEKLWCKMKIENYGEFMAKWHNTNALRNAYRGNKKSFVTLLFHYMIFPILQESSNSNVNHIMQINSYRN